MQYMEDFNLDDDYLAQFGEKTAIAMLPEESVNGQQISRAVKAQLNVLYNARNWLGKSAHSSAPAQWILDNWYLVQREAAEAAITFRRAGRLRAVRGSNGHRPYIIELSKAIIEATVGCFTAHRLELFLTGARSGRPFTEQELSLLIPALKLTLVERLAALCPAVKSLQEEKEQEEEAHLNKTMEHIFRAFRLLISADFTKLLEGTSGVEAALLRDPSGMYQQMDDDTRRRYRQAVCKLAKDRSLTEEATAEQILALSYQATGTAHHVGWYIFRQPMGDKLRAHSGIGYLSVIIISTLAISLFLGFSLGSVTATLVLILPVSDIIKNCFDFLTVRLVPPRHVHRLALKNGLPAEGRTLCVIAALLTDKNSGPRLAGQLERYRLANRDSGPNLMFGILADLPDSAAPMGCKGREAVAAARCAIHDLNRKYGGGFYLFYRPPVFHTTDERYMGWERKRGALIELVRLLKGRRTGIKTESGDQTQLCSVAYVITLDSDTTLNVGAARELIGAMLHPLNRPKIDERRGVVLSGHGLLQPRIGVDLEAANRSQFSRIFAGQGGVDPYGSAASDVYHDLFEEGTYTGKGVFDVDAFFTCLDRRFPQNAVLSHDLLEGAYLHAGLLGDVELTDSYPYKVIAYLARLHRWVRGDWQLLPWLTRHVKNEAGEKEKNPLDTISKWKIFDNLRRSLSPISTLLALLLGMCFSGSVFAAAAGTAILSAASNLLLSGAELAFRGGRGLRSRYHSTIIAGFGGVILQTLVQLLLLPCQAWTCASAITTSLWRQAVTHRRLLDWVTAADVEQSAGNGIGNSYHKLWPAAMIGLVAALFARYPAGGAVGLIWLLSPLFAWAMSRPITQRQTAAEADKAFLLHQGAQIWNFFADFLRPEDHWLPPDNWQAQPNPTLARRTSPTNIGLALLSILAAADLDYCTREHAITTIDHMISTMEALPKWNGHLYNWYDTATMKPLNPHYVSTVDSGNLCGCLITLREGLYEWGEDKLARRAEALSADMKFAALYDENRKLFYIGYDVEGESFTLGWYDLMASEARQTSYIAIARGEVSPRHWRRLGRTLVSCNQYNGMASWTGTMFEYFMPHLIMPAYQNSLIYESLAFCITVQKSRTIRAGVPWGISESAFYALDAGLNYQYKAHGVQKLGLKRELDTELVVSPYSSFLALLLAPRSASRNLRRLRDMGMEGKYGFYEAADFTASRIAGGSKFRPVRSFMAHHLGMSLVAIDNALKENVMQQRFLRDCSMSAYRELLQEKVPVGAEVMKSPAREVPEKPGRTSVSSFQRSGTWQEGSHPPCHLVSNGAYTVLCSADGCSKSHMGNTALTRNLQIALASPPSEIISYRFSTTAAWTTTTSGITLMHTLQVPEGENGEIREIILKNESDTTVLEELVLYLEPILAQERDFEAHPVFSKLFLESAFTGDGVVFTRRARRGTEGTPAMAVLWDAPHVFFDTSREAALGRGGLRALRYAYKKTPQSTIGAVLDPCLLARVPVTLFPGESRTISFAIAASDSGEDAIQAALRLLLQPRQREQRRLDRLITTLKMTSETTLQAFELLDELVRQTTAGKAFNPKQLWPFGISGDLPIKVIEKEEEQSKWLRCHQLLTRCGYSFDLVFLIDEGGDYRRPLRSAILAQMKSTGWEHQLGARGGIHLVDGPAAALREIAENPVSPNDVISRPSTLYVLETGVPLWEAKRDSFVFYTGPRLPPVGWSQMLCNEEFGWFTDETGCGHLWLGNARENPLTPWQNDPLAIGGAERIFLRTQNGERSLFADADGLSCTVTYSPGLARWEKKWASRTVTTTAFVPMGENTRYLLIELEGPPCELLYDLLGKGEMRYTLVESVVFSTRPDNDGTGVCSVVLPGAEKEVKLLLNRTIMHWNRCVSSLKIHTPNQMLDDYINGWALYQVVSCRLYGRTSRYQNGGAYGFRDQLQDVCATILTDPEMTAAQVLRACAHQFEEGDVQHWWHPPEGKGVRTRVSDDLLWLPYVLCEYTETHGDTGLLAEIAPYLKSPVLSCKERERYEQPEVSGLCETVYEHAIRAVEHALTRGMGAHGLALMGTGDWNDGMDLVGAEGKGESVWLSWFLSHILQRFALICDRMEDAERGANYRTLAEQYAEAANAAWDGNWFLRGYYDNGSTLGSHEDSYCQLDSIAQSFAAFNIYADSDKTKTAVKSAVERLFNKEAGVVQLFDPPFDKGEKDPGYIRGYVPGVRENGGQYTHAAVWLSMACFRLNMISDGYAILNAILPATHDAAIYRAEPYVLAADVYSNQNHLGRGGWSWYTGAAGWYYRTVIHELLGLKVRCGRLFLEPRLPRDWPGCSAIWRTEKMTLHIEIEHTGKNTITLDGCPIENGVDIAHCSEEHTLRFTFE